MMALIRRAAGTPGAGLRGNKGKWKPPQKRWAGEENRTEGKQSGGWGSAHASGMRLEVSTKS